MLKVFWISPLRAFCSISLLIAQSVVRYPSMVHMLGWIMPLPLLMPPRRTVTLPPSAAGRSKATAHSLFTVSVVMMARLAAVPASRLPSSVSFIWSTPAASRSRGNWGPMTPVEPSSTLSAGMPRARPACSAVFWQRAIPASPVPALAMPALTTTARACLPPYTIF